MTETISSGVQADMIRMPEHAAKNPVCPFPLADHSERLSQPEGTDRECALLAFQSIRLAIVVDQFAILRGELAGDGEDGASDPGWSHGRKRTIGIANAAASRASSSYDCTKDCRFSLHPRSMISPYTASRAARQVAVSDSRVSSSAMRIPRSSATQLITLLKTYWRTSPYFPDARVGEMPVPAHPVHQAA